MFSQQVFVLLGEKALQSFFLRNNQAAPERWPSGRRRSPAKGVYVKSVSWVRIPSSPPSISTKRLMALRKSTRVDRLPYFLPHFERRIAANFGEQLRPLCNSCVGVCGDESHRWQQFNMPCRIGVMLLRQIMRVQTPPREQSRRLPTYAPLLPCWLVTLTTGMRKTFFGSDKRFAKRRRGCCLRRP